MLYSFREPFICFKFIVKIHLELHYRNKKVRERVPQSQTAALPRHQEEEETDKSKQA